MGTAGGTAPLRRTGSLLGLLGLESAAVLGLHWLGRFAGLRIGWDEPVQWLLNSPIQNVLGSILRMVALVMAYWLLTSTVAYLLASLTRLPGAVRAVGWATLPLVRRVADHAVAVTLATSMVGGTTLGVAGPAVAADGRRYGPPAPKPVAAAGATELGALAAEGGAQDGPTTTEPEPTRTSEPVYTPDPAGQAPTTTAPQAAPPPPTTEPPTTTPPATEAEPTRTSKPVYTPDPAGQAPRRLQDEEPATPTAGATTTEGATTTTAASTATTAATSTTAATATTAATRPPATRQDAAAQTSASTTSTTRPAEAAGTPATTHAYDPEPASDPPDSRMANSGSGTTGNPGGSSNPTNPGGSKPSKEPGGDDDQGSGHQAQTYVVVRGDNLWTIARDHLSRVRGSGTPPNHEVAAYWVKVVAVNRDHLRSRNEDLIYPGERITLPRVDD